MLIRPLNDLPALNACLNATSTVLLIAAWVFARRGNYRAHGFTIITALVCSAAFLTSYLYYHSVLKMQTPFTGPVWLGYIYKPMLLTHIILAVVILPMIIMSVLHAARRRWDRHRRLTRWTMPLWLYVSITGVLVYAMLYQVR